MAKRNDKSFFQIGSDAMMGLIKAMDEGRPLVARRVRSAPRKKKAGSKKRRTGPG